jgi:hypothetical protein
MIVRTVRKMAKRELIDKDNFWIDLQVQTPLSIAIRRNTVTEQKIVKPYLEKILNDMFDDEFLQNNMSGDIWERIEDIVNNVLSEDGEK